MKREEEVYVLVPAGFRERKRQTYLKGDGQPRTWEQIQEQEQRAAAAKREAEAKEATEKTAEHAEFERQKQADSW